MPVPILKDEAKKHHTSLEKQETKWEHAKSAANKEYGPNHWGAVMSIYENMAGSKKK